MKQFDNVVATFDNLIM